MKLDDLEAMARVDEGHMLKWIDSLPQQCLDAWEAMRAMELPADYRGVARIVISGMGGSAIGGSLLQALAGPECPLPIEVVAGTIGGGVTWVTRASVQAKPGRRDTVVITWSLVRRADSPSQRRPVGGCLAAGRQGAPWNLRRYPRNERISN